MGSQWRDWQRGMEDTESEASGGIGREGWRTLNGEASGGIGREGWRTLNEKPVEGWQIWNS
ncbi:unnamed protein product [Staurois parvus]|uniref:Uncharacterized protein n=1 Tax=Staurois parvus TaxID=386267 RepID=A0ABN9H7G0_9NEOB|nr:unnamed protein product [Staurois parvus]